MNGGSTANIAAEMRIYRSRLDARIELGADAKGVIARCRKRIPVLCNRLRNHLICHRSHGLFLFSGFFLYADLVDRSRIKHIRRTPSLSTVGAQRMSSDDS